MDRGAAQSGQFHDLLYILPFNIKIIHFPAYGGTVNFSLIMVTGRNQQFSYIIKKRRDGSNSGEMFISRKEKSITKATVMIAFHKALELMDAEGSVSGPKKLGTFGASYLYPVFIRLFLPENRRL